MDKKKKAALITGGIVAATAITAKVMEKQAQKTTYKAEEMDPIPEREKSFYEKHVKRGLDVACATAAITVFSPLYLTLAALVRKNLGSPVLFTQERPGLTKDGKETIFKLYKFRTMTDERGEDGELLPDEKRLTKFGAWLRSTSLDELPEAFNILNGTMSVIGPRPQLVRDMVFMDERQRSRHTAKPGLSGLAQVNGRNAISWEDKFKWDEKYLGEISFKKDAGLVLKTVGKAFIKQEGITEEGQATAEDFGDYLLKEGKVSEAEYQQKLEEAKQILDCGRSGRTPGLVSIITPSYNTAPYIADTIKSVLAQTYTNWEMIIVDDCSTDNTDEVVQPFLSDPRIHYLHNEKNSGAAISRNRALREARGQWIAFLDSDDQWYPEKLEKQIRFMEENHYSFSYTNYEEMDQDGTLTGVHISGPRKITTTGMTNYCWPGCLTVMYDASKVGLIQIADIKKNNDYAMWIEVSKKADCYLLNECLAKYRRGRSGSVSSHSIKTMVGWHYKLWHEAEDNGVVESLVNTCRNMVFGLYKKKRYVVEQEV